MSNFAQCITSAARAVFKNVLQMTTFNVKYFTSFDVTYHTWMIYKPIHIKNLFRAFVLKQITFTIHLKTGRFFFFFFFFFFLFFWSVYMSIWRYICTNGQGYSFTCVQGILYFNNFKQLKPLDRQKFIYILTHEARGPKLIATFKVT